MDSLSATELFDAMLASVYSLRYARTTTDPSSPAKQTMLEAVPGQTFKFNPYCNVVQSRSIDVTWAYANVLHFFAGVEEANVLRRYNKLADKFLTGSRWIGAYGAIAMPQVKRCIELLRNSRESRRAIVSTGELDVQDANRPACWNTLHFLVQGDALYTMVYQRSINVWGVMPYDAIVLSNVHNYVRYQLGLSSGTIVWTVGSLHAPERPLFAVRTNKEPSRLYVPWELVPDAMAVLEQPEKFKDFPNTRYLLEETRS